MNYKIILSNGENEIERFYEESAFNEVYYLSSQLDEMKETLDKKYPDNWDEQGDLEELAKDKFLNK